MKNSKTAKPPSTRARPPGKSAEKRRRTYLPAEERRRRILAAAQEVFSRSSLHAARTRDLAKAAEVNQATLFEHFDSKEALFHEAVLLPLLDAMRGMRGRAEAYAGAGSVEEMRELARDSLRRHIETMVKIFPLFASAFFSDLDAGRKIYREQMAPVLKQRSEAISGLVRDELNPQFVELATFGVLLAIAMDQRYMGKRWSLEQLVDQFSILITSGFAKKPSRSSATK